VPSEIYSGGFYRARGPKSTGRCPNPDHAADTSFAERDRRLVWPNISDNLVVPAGACVFEVVRSWTFCEQTVVELHIYADEHGNGSSGLEVEPARRAAMRDARKARREAHRQ
jgi:hypothetical protein